MLVFAQVDVTRPVFPYVLCQDAQGASKRDAGGAGLVFGRPPQTEVLRAALSTEPGGRGRIVGPEMIALGCDHISGLPPASPWNEAWQKTRWYDTLAVDWKFKDHIHLGEARALNLWLEISSRLPLVRGTRIVNLCDSQSATHAFAKGRSHVFALNQLLRKRASLEIVANVSLLVGWVSTKVQPADRLSRWRIVQGLMKGLRFLRRTPSKES